MPCAASGKWPNVMPTNVPRVPGFVLADGMGIPGTILAAGFRFSRCLLARNIEHSMAHEEGCGFR